MILMIVSGLVYQLMIAYRLLTILFMQFPECFRLVKADIHFILILNLRYHLFFIAQKKRRRVVSDYRDYRDLNEVFKLRIRIHDAKMTRPIAIILNLTNHIEFFVKVQYI